MNRSVVVANQSWELAVFGVVENNNANVAAWLEFVDSWEVVLTAAAPISGASSGGKLSSLILCFVLKTANFSLCIKWDYSGTYFKVHWSRIFTRRIYGWLREGNCVVIAANRLSGFWGRAFDFKQTWRVLKFKLVDSWRSWSFLKISQFWKLRTYIKSVCVLDSDFDRNWVWLFVLKNHRRHANVD